MAGVPATPTAHASSRLPALVKIGRRPLGWREYMRKRSLLLLAGAAAIVASLVIGPAATAGPDKASAGTVVFIHDQEPPNLRPSWVDNSLYATSLIDNSIFQGGQIYNNNAQWVTRLFTGPPKLLKKQPAHDAVHVQPEGGLVRRHARHLRRLACDVADLDQPREQPGEPHRLRGHQVGQLQGQDGHRHLQEGVRRLGDPPQQRPSGPRSTRSARTRTSCGRTRSPSPAVPGSSRAGRRARRSRS